MPFDRQINDLVLLIS